MLDNILFSTDRVLPFFVVILLGWLLRRTGAFDAAFFSQINRFIYRVAFPLTMFQNVWSIDWRAGVSLRLPLIALVLTALSFGVSWLINELFVRDKALIGTLVQGSCRGNFMILGVPLLLAVAGESMRPQVMIASAMVIPFYGVMSTVVLSVRGRGTAGVRPAAVAKNVLRTPMVIGALAALGWSALRLPTPVLLSSPLSYVAQTATGLGLLALGGSIEWRPDNGRLGLAVYAALCKTVLIPVAAVGAAYLLGLRRMELFYIFGIFGSPTAIVSYSTARELGGNGPLAANLLLISTLLSVLTLSGGICLMRGLHWVS